MKRYIVKSIKYTSIIAGSLLVFLIGATLIITFLFKKQAIEFVIKQLERQVDAKIQIAQVDFTLWKQFPNASIFFTNVYAQSSNKFKAALHLKDDTLLVANKIYFEFNLIKLIKGEYKFKRLNIKDGYLKLLINTDGSMNYDIIKKSKEPSEKEFELELNDLLLTNTFLEYNNLKTQVKLKGLAERLSVKGNFKASSYDLKIQSFFHAKEFSISEDNYVIDKSLELAFNLQVDNKYYQIEDGNFKIVNLQFMSAGNFDLSDNPKIDLQITGKKLRLSQIFDVLPARFQKPLKDYTCEGNAKMEMHIKGSINKGSFPKVDVHYSLEKGSIIQKTTGIRLHNISLAGIYSNCLSNKPQNTVIKFNKFCANLGSGEISGTGTLENLFKPKLKINVTTKLDLNELKSFFKLERLEILKGSVESVLNASLGLERLSNIKTTDIKDLTCNGNIKLTDAGIKIQKSDYHFENINGTITLNNDVYFDNLSLFVHGNDFNIKGVLPDGLKYFLKQRKDLTLQAEVTSCHLDLSKYFVTNPNKPKYSREFLFPEDINLDVKVNINDFKLNKFNAKWITGYLSYKPTMFVLKSVAMETFTGHISGNAVVLQDLYKNFIIKGQVDASKIDLQNMFYTFNNFSQVVIEDRHLRGNLWGKISFSTEWNKALMVNQDKILVDADLTINNGRLINYEPLQSLSDYISLEELKDIKFSTLKNRIYVKDKQVIIPQMDVASSAFNISASGTHNFDNHYNYKLKVLLSEVLWGKARRAKRENEEFGVVEDDGLGKTSLYLSITGYKKDFKISYDSKKTMVVVKESLDKQKNELKTIFKKEFGWGKKDTTIQKSQSPKKETIQVEWEENDKPLPEDNKPTKKTRRKQENKPVEEKFKVEWE